MEIAISICICVAILIIVAIYLNDVAIYQIGRGRKKIVIIGGVHGNEPAGALALTKLLREKYFDNLPAELLSKYTFVIIPRANEFGLLFGSRRGPTITHGDINRNFHSRGGRTKISNKISVEVRDAFLVLDFHEGWGYVRQNKGSIGSSISPLYNDKSIWVKSLAESIQNRLNQRIDTAYKKFKVLYNTGCDANEESGKMLGCFAEMVGVNYILFEISGQNNIQPMKLRESQVRRIINVVLEKIAII